MDSNTNLLRSIRNVLIVILFIIIVYLMKVLASIVIPLVLAFLIALAFQPLITFLRRFKIPKLIILPFVTIITLGILFGIGLIFFESISQIVLQQDYIILKTQQLGDNVLSWLTSLNLPLDYDSVGTQITNWFDITWFSRTAGSVARELGSFAGSFTFFAIYYVLLISGMSEYKAYLIYVKGDDNDNNYDIIKEYENIQHSISSYISVKTLISIGTGLLAYGLCELYGVPFALFWGFLTFLLNYIPSVGSTIATIFPIVMGLIEYGSLEPILIFAILLIIVQFVMGNIIEPIAMGSSLRLNTLTVIFGLVFWGFLWGVPGMILSVPLIAVIKITLEQFPSFSFAGRIMGYPSKKSKLVELIKKETKFEDNKSDSEDKSKS